MRPIGDVQESCTPRALKETMIETLNVPRSLTEIWAGKQVNWTRGKGWCDYTPSQAPVVTAWFRDENGRAEVECDANGNPARLAIPADGWIYPERTQERNKVAEYIKMCNDCWMSETQAQVILLIGKRNPAGIASQAREAVVRQDAYAVRFTKVQEDGLIEGVFVSRPEYRQWLGNR